MRNGVPLSLGRTPHSLAGRIVARTSAMGAMMQGLSAAAGPPGPPFSTRHKPSNQEDEGGNEQEASTGHEGHVRRRSWVRPAERWRTRE